MKSPRDLSPRRTAVACTPEAELGNSRQQGARHVEVTLTRSPRRQPLSASFTLKKTAGCRYTPRRNNGFPLRSLFYLYSVREHFRKHFKTAVPTYVERDCDSTDVMDRVQRERPSIAQNRDRRENFGFLSNITGQSRRRLAAT